MVKRKVKEEDSGNTSKQTKTDPDPEVMYDADTESEAEPEIQLSRRQLASITQAVLDALHLEKKEQSGQVATSTPKQYVTKTVIKKSNVKSNVGFENISPITSVNSDPQPGLSSGIIKNITAVPKVPISVVSDSKESQIRHHLQEFMGCDSSNPTNLTANVYGLVTQGQSAVNVPPTAMIWNQELASDSMQPDYNMVNLQQPVLNNQYVNASGQNVAFQNSGLLGVNQTPSSIPVLTSVGDNVSLSSQLTTATNVSQIYSMPRFSIPTLSRQWNQVPCSNTYTMPSSSTFAAASQSTAGLSEDIAVRASLFGALAQESPQAMNDAIRVLLGKSETFNMSFTTLDQGISDRVKTEIWNHHYVDFVQLLRLHTAYAEPTLLKTPKVKNEKIHSYLAWTKAFEVFHVIYIQKYPDQSSALIQYSSVIRDLHHRAPTTYAWREYDERFRYRRQSTQCPWDWTDPELWMKAMMCAVINVKNYTPANPFSTDSNPKNSDSHSSSTTQVTTTSKANSQSKFNHNQNKGDRKPFTGGKFNALFQTCKSKNMCFRFQNGTCSGPCKFKHICHLCSGEHSPSSCAKSKDTTSGSKQ